MQILYLSGLILLLPYLSSIKAHGDHHHDHGDHTELHCGQQWLESRRLLNHGRKLVSVNYESDVNAGKFVNVNDADKIGLTAPIRIKYDFQIVNNSTYVCTEVGQVINTCPLWFDQGYFCDSSFTCRDIDIVDNAKYSIIQDRTAWAKKHLALTWKLKPVVGLIDYSTLLGAQYLTNTTESNVDLVIIMTMFPTAEFITGYAMCVLFDQYDRCIVGLLNWVPGPIVEVTSTTYDSIMKDRHTLLHETFHLFGAVGIGTFIDTNGNPLSMGNWSFDGTFGDSNYVSGESIRQITSTKTLEIARKQYSCPDLPGVPLEDYSVGVNAHWEARIMGPELMAYGFSSGESYLSDLTLAFVEDIGQMIANYSNAGPIMDVNEEQYLVRTGANILSLGSSASDLTVEGQIVNRSPGYLKWGRNLGCEFVYSPSSWPSYYMCGKQGDKGCTSDNRALGQCTIVDYTNLGGPPPFDVWIPSNPNLGGFSPAMDYVPIFKSYITCKDVKGPVFVGTTSDPNLLGQQKILNNIRNFGGQSFCDDCRCLTSTLRDISSIFSSTANYGLCYRTNCVNSQYLQMHINGAWYGCPQGGGKIFIAGLTGFILCPFAQEFCMGEKQSGTFYPEGTGGDTIVFFVFVYGGFGLYLFMRFFFTDFTAIVVYRARHFMGVTATSTKDGLYGGEVVEDWNSKRNRILLALIIISCVYFLLLAFGCFVIAFFLISRKIDSYPTLFGELGTIFLVVSVLGISGARKGQPNLRFILFLYCATFFCILSLFFIAYKSSLQGFLVNQIQENWVVWKYLITSTQSNLNTNSTAISAPDSGLVNTTTANLTVGMINYGDIAGSVNAAWWVFSLLFSFTVIFGFVGSVCTWRLFHTRVLIHNFFCVLNGAIIIGGPIIIWSIGTTLLKIEQSISINLIVPIAFMIPSSCFGFYGHYRYSQHNLKIYAVIMLLLCFWLGSITIWASLSVKKVLISLQNLSDDDIGVLFATSLSSLVAGILTKQKLITAIDNYMGIINVILFCLLGVLAFLCFCIIYIEIDLKKLDENLAHQIEEQLNRSGSMALRRSKAGSIFGGVVGALRRASTINRRRKTNEKNAVQPNNGTTTAETALNPLTTELVNKGALATLSHTIVEAEGRQFGQKAFGSPQALNIAEEDSPVQTRRASFYGHTELATLESGEENIGLVSDGKALTPTRRTSLSHSTHSRSSSTSSKTFQIGSALEESPELKQRRSSLREELKELGVSDTLLSEIVGGKAKRVSLKVEVNNKVKGEGDEGKGEEGGSRVRGLSTESTSSRRASFHGVEELLSLEREEVLGLVSDGKSLTPTRRGSMTSYKKPSSSSPTNQNI